MSDIITRLRQTRADMIGTDDEQHYWDCHDAACEIERLNREVSILIAECQKQKDLLVNGATLTDGEREAVWFAIAYAQNAGHECESTLRGLLKRLGAANNGDDRRSGGGE